MASDMRRAGIELKIAEAYVTEAARPCIAEAAECDPSYLDRAVRLLQQASARARQCLDLCAGRRSGC